MHDEFIFNGIHLAITMLAVIFGFVCGAIYGALRRSDQCRCKQLRTTVKLIVDKAHNIAKIEDVNDRYTETVQLAHYILTRINSKGEIA